MTRFIWLFIVILISYGNAQSADSIPDGIEGFIAKAKEAIEKENYEYAVGILNAGKARYPQAAEPAILLGDLYSDKKLYNLALKEYQEADRRLPGDDEILHRIATAYGRLNEEDKAVDYLEKVLSLEPDNPEIITDLGWMYFKTHRLAEGEKLLLGSIDKYGNNRSFAMTLGTIYSGMYEYRKAKESYLFSIQDALKNNGQYFASVAYYNLSLLEHGFYRFNSALDYTNRSLEMSERAPGHISKGELYQSRMDFKQAHDEYQRALALDTTPLAKLNLADLYRKFGLFKNAYAYVDDVIKSTDLSWMYYFGTDIERHSMDLYRILADLYEGMAHEERLIPKIGLLHEIKSFFLIAQYSIMEWYYRQKQRANAIRTGKKYFEEGNLLDAYWSFYKGNEGYPEIALKYLIKAREIEVSVAPGALPSYIQEEGKIKKNIALLQESISKFQPEWEKEGIAESLRLLIPLLNRKNHTEARRMAVNRLYSINPGALLQSGFGLPILLVSDLKVSRPGFFRKITSLLRKSGFEVGFSDGPGFTYQMSITCGEGNTIVYLLKDRRNMKAIYNESLTLPAFTGKNLVKLVQDIVDNTYRIR
ncbi:MAG: tetratricopeptide repeat protein [Spirochaetota bacterium]